MNDLFDIDCIKDKCEDIICPNGFCDAGSCTCYDGFIKIESICKETCSTNSCEVYKY